MPPENNVQFEGESGQSAFRSRVILGQLEVPKMIRFMIGKGIVNEEKTAGNILMGMSITFFIVMIGALIYYFNLGKPGKLTPDAQVRIQEMMINSGTN